MLKGKEIFINTGSTPILPDVEGINKNKHVFTSETLLRQTDLPRHLLILGAGAIGMEFATMYAGFGSKVTLLETGNRFMPKSDRDIAESMQESLKRKGIEIRLNAYALSIYDTANSVTLTYTDNSDGTPYFLEGDALLLATGRRPMTDGLNLHAAGVQTDAQGAIVVNKYLQTTSPHIWAIGDVRGGALYDYLSIDDFRIITNQLFGNKQRHTDDRNPVPYVIFTDPPLAHIGMTEEEAVKRGYSIQVSRLPAAAVSRARTLQHIDGMLKAIVNAHTGRIIGCTLFCADAPEVVNLVSLAMKTGQHYSILRDFIFTHPSMSEGLNDLFKAFSISGLAVKRLTSIFATNQKRGMKTKRYIAYFLFFISMIMLIVPVIPHHHHENGIICMKNDLPSEGCCHHQGPCNEHCCCDTGCMTTHFYQQTPNSDNSDIQPCFVWVTTLFSEPLLRLLALPEETGIRQEFVYQESLHGTFITRATGLRAPPSVLA